MEIVALIRWLGQSGIEALLEEEAITFSFHPGIIPYISEANKKALSLESVPV